MAEGSAQERHRDAWWRPKPPRARPAIHIDGPLAGPIPKGVDFIHKGLNRAARRQLEKETRGTHP